MDPIWNKIQKARKQRAGQINRQRRAEEKRIREHEREHLKHAGPHAGEVQWIRNTDENNIEHIVGGRIPLDLTIESNPEKTLRKYEKLLQSAQAPKNLSEQDKLMARWLTNRINNLKRAKNK